MKNYNEQEVLKSLFKKKDIKISNKSITVSRVHNDVGNGSWGKIDFLTNYLNYSVRIE